MREVKRQKMLMAVYNNIQLDGRVQRAAKALAYDYDLVLCSVNSSADYTEVPCRNVNFKIGRFTFARFLIKLLYLFIKEKPDIIYLHDYNMIAMLPLIWPFRKCKIIYDAHETIAVNKKSIVPPIIRRFFALEKKVISRCDLIFVPVKERATFMRRFYGLQNIHLFKNIPEYSFTAIPEKDTKPERPVKIIYQGVINKNRKLDRLLYLAKELGSHFQFDIVGYGSDEAYLKSLAQELELDNVHFLGKVSPQNLHKYLLHADIGLAFYPNDSINTRFCAPNKIYEYAQARLLVVSSNQWLFKDTFKEFPFGVAVNIENDPIGSIADQVRDIAKLRGKHIPFAEAFIQQNDPEQELIRLRETVAKYL